MLVESRWQPSVNLENTTVRGLTKYRFAPGSLVRRFCFWSSHPIKRMTAGILVLLACVSISFMTGSCSQTSSRLEDSQTWVDSARGDILQPLDGNNADSELVSDNGCCDLPTVDTLDVPVDAVFQDIDVAIPDNDMVTDAPDDSSISPFDVQPDLQEDIGEGDSLPDSVFVCSGDAQCSDGDDCNGIELCEGGVCLPGQPPILDDGNECTDDVCIPGEGIVHPAVLNGDPCDDDNACTLVDTCFEGQCVGDAPKTCEDTGPCREEAVCEPDTGVCISQDLPDGTGCDDMDACTQIDECQAGECAGTDPIQCPAGLICQGSGVCNPETGTCAFPNLPDATSCSDGDPCNGDETCQSGVCVPGEPPDLDDGNPCTNDQCEFDIGVVHLPLEDGVSCDDGDVCNGIEQCGAGACISGEPPLVDDGDPCTMDLCDPVAGVSHPAVDNGVPCDDGDACSKVDTCVDGVCIGGEPTTCEDAGPCRDEAICDPDTGFCEAEDLPDGIPCDDEDGCTQVDECLGGECLGFNPVICPVGGGCQGSGVCNSATGICTYPDLPDATSCSDEDPCNGDETCQSGACVPGEPLALDDGNPCTVDFCEPGVGVFHPPVEDGVSCDDGDVCNGIEQCGAGACIPGEPPLVDDSDPCTVDLCDPITGVIYSAADNGELCDDGDACTQVDTCIDGICIGGDLTICEDAGPCKDEAACDPTTGLCGAEDLPDGASCNDGDACTLVDECQEGDCLGFDPVTCLVGEVCQGSGACDPETGICAYPNLPDATSCSDGDPCNGDETCQSGACVPGEPPALNDGNPCTADFCDPDTGVLHLPYDDGIACDDGDPATWDGSCEAGICQLGPEIPLSFLPDTGQEVCYHGTGVIPCGNEDSLWFGQDGDFLSHTMEYEASIPGAISDLVTGLLWEQSPASMSVNYLQAENHCAGLTLAGLEWRLPNRRELLTIVDYGTMSNQGPTLNPIFGQTQSAYYWTTDTSGTNPDRKMRVSFKYGTSLSQDDGFQDGYVRCVAGDAAISAQELIAIPQEFSVYDPTAGLIWQRVPSGYLTWQGALDYCLNLDSVGNDRWRLPDVRELATLLVPEEAYPVLDPALFPGVKSGEVMWTSTTSNKPTSLNQAYIVGLGDQGTIGTGKKTDNYQVLCVRACPCPDPACCQSCRPVDDGLPCDDEDPDSVWDSCWSGFCIGEAIGNSPPVPPALYDCTNLDCGPAGRCIVGDEGEECVCDIGFEEQAGTCISDPTWMPPVDDTCIPFDSGVGEICLVESLGWGTFGAGGGANPAPGDGGPPEEPPPDLPDDAPDSPFIDAPSGFVVHQQSPTSWCVPNSFNAAIELLLGSLYQPLSEAHIVSLVQVPGGEHSACVGFFTGADFEDILQDQHVENYLVSDDTWPVPDVAKCEDIHIGDTEPEWWELSQGIAALAEDGVDVLYSVDQSADIEAVKVALNADQPVVVGVPVIYRPDMWKKWSSSRNPIISDWPSSDTVDPEVRCGTVPVDLGDCYCSRHSDCMKACVIDETCVGDYGSQVLDIPLRCHRGVCIAGMHAVVLVGYEESAGGDGAFFFLNSWGGWGDAVGGYPSGIGKMSFDFLENMSRFAKAVTALELRCADPTQEGVCSPGHTKCKNSYVVETCTTLPNGCLGYVGTKGCISHWHCDDGDCIPTIGDGWCVPSEEDCQTSPDDCPCPDGAVCEDGQCVMTCEHECETGDSGCVDSTTRWFCGLLPDGDACRDIAPVPCSVNKVCQDGACVTNCIQDHKACKPGTDEVWWYDSCGDPYAWVATCPAGCQGGTCNPECTSHDSTACYDDDVYFFDSCGDPEEVAIPCGTSGYSGQPYCSDDHQSVIHDFFSRGCSVGGCFSDYEPEVVPCIGGSCVGGVCVSGGSYCSDGICSPGVEDCASCPDDCPCWSGNAPYCSDSGQCVQCIENSQCPDGSTCSAGNCAAGCHQCSPQGIFRCGSGGEREICTQVINCRMWVGSPCGWSEGCCQGECVSTTPPPPQIPLLPAHNATAPAGTVHFEWDYAGSANRITLAICNAPNLQGTCMIKEPEPTWWYLNVSLPPGDYWWAVRGITTCDLSGWGEYSEIRELHIP